MDVIGLIVDIKNFIIRVQEVELSVIKVIIGIIQIKIINQIKRNIIKIVNILLLHIELIIKFIVIQKAFIKRKDKNLG